MSAKQVIFLTQTSCEISMKDDDVTVSWKVLGECSEQSWKETGARSRLLEHTMMCPCIAAAHRKIFQCITGSASRVTDSEAWPVVVGRGRKGKVAVTREVMKEVMKDGVIRFASRCT